MPGIIYKGYSDGSVDFFDQADLEISGLTGFSRQEFISRRIKWYDLILPEDRVSLKEAARKALASDHTFAVEYRIKDRDGNTRWIEDRGQVIPDSRGGLEYVTGVLFDITGLREAEETLKGSPDTSAGTLESIPVGLLIYQHEPPDRLTLVSGNVRAQQLTGIEVKESLGKEFGEIWPKVGRRSLKGPCLAALKRRRALMTKDYYKNGGVGGPLRVRVFPMPQKRLGVAFESVDQKGRARGRMTAAAGEPQGHLNEITALLEGARAVLENKDFSDAARAIFYSLKRLVGAGSGYIALLNEDESAFVPLFFQREIEPAAESSFGSMPAGGVLDELGGQKDPRYHNRATKSRWARLMPAASESPGNILAAPMIVEGRPVGLVVLGDKPEGFNDNDSRLAAGFAELASVALMSTRSRESLEIGEEFFRSVVQTANDAVVSIDSSGKIIFWNNGAESIFGYTPEEILDSPLTLLMPQKFRRVHQKGFERAIETGLSFPMRKTIEVVGLKKDGSEFPLELSLASWETKEGIFFTGIARDVTERKRAEEQQRQLEAQVQHAQKLESLGILAGGIAHDFNNLLMSILGNAGLALMDLAPENSAYPSIKQVETAAKRASELTNQMLAYSGKGKFVVRSLDLSMQVEEMTHLLRTVISKKITLEYDFSPGIPATHADPAQVRQVIMNLITNASEAIGDARGTIRVATGVMDAHGEYFQHSYLDYEPPPPGCYVYLQVTDTGMGMDSETVAKIFDPFFTTKFTGRGLGLAAVLGIVRGHRGAVKIESEPGAGTTFKVFFPCSSESEAEVKGEKKTREHKLGSGTILVVDDEESVQSVTREILTKVGYDVLTAKDGLEGIEVFRKNLDRIDLVLLDLTMPHMSGDETLKEILEVSEDARVILTSGYSEYDISERFSDIGIAGFIQKPFQISDLVEKIREVLN